MQPTSPLSPRSDALLEATLAEMQGLGDDRLEEDTLNIFFQNAFTLFEARERVWDACPAAMMTFNFFQVYRQLHTLQRQVERLQHLAWAFQEQAAMERQVRSAAEDLRVLYLDHQFDMRSGSVSDALVRILEHPLGLPYFLYRAELEHSPNRRFNRLVAHGAVQTLMDSHPYCLRAFQEFAFSPDRIRHLLASRSRMTPERLEALERREQALRESGCVQIILDELHDCDTWREARQRGSSSATGSHQHRAAVVSAWECGNRWMRELASRRRRDKRLCVADVQYLHRLSVAEEESIPGGIWTQRDSRTASRGRGFPTGEFTPRLMHDFVEWLNDRVDACHAGEESPALVAAQTGQYFVTVHPFQDGNGRTGRFLMDYALESCSMPPPALDFSSATSPATRLVRRPFEPREPSSAADESLMEAVLEGVERSVSTASPQTPDCPVDESQPKSENHSRVS